MEFGQGKNRSAHGKFREVSSGGASEESAKKVSKASAGRWKKAEYSEGSGWIWMDLDGYPLKILHPDPASRGCRNKIRGEGAHNVSSSLGDMQPVNSHSAAADLHHSAPVLAVKDGLPGILGAHDDTTADGKG